jgi:acetate kinase
MSAKQFNEMVNFQSGLLGISETSSDMRDLLKQMKRRTCGRLKRSRCFATRSRNGSAHSRRRWADWTRWCSLGGIGENAPPVRARICDGLGFLGIELEEKRNARMKA